MKIDRFRVTNKQQKEEVRKGMRWNVVFQPSIAENSWNVICWSPSELKRSKMTLISGFGRFLSITKTSLVNSSRLRFPSLLLSKLLKICFKFRLWFLIIRFSSATSFFARSFVGSN